MTTQPNQPPASVKLEHAIAQFILRFDQKKKIAYHGNNQATEGLKAAINKLYIPRSEVEEAIGEDEPTGEELDYDEWDELRADRNELRAELRKKLGLEEK